MDIYIYIGFIQYASRHALEHLDNLKLIWENSSNAYALYRNTKDIYIEREVNIKEMYRNM